jgi:hypothetical protein
MDSYEAMSKVLQVLSFVFITILTILMSLVILPEFM